MITKHRSALDKIAEALLEHETIEGKHVLEIIQHGELRSAVIVAPPSKYSEKAIEKKSVEKPATSESIEPGSPAAAPNPA